jgi:hypothetical protein
MYLLDANVFIQAKNLHYGSTSVLLSGNGSPSSMKPKRFSASRKFSMS